MEDGDEKTLAFFCNLLPTVNANTRLLVTGRKTYSIGRRTMGIATGATTLAQWHMYIKEIRLAPIKSGEPISKISREIKKFLEATDPGRKLVVEKKEKLFDLSKSTLLRNLDAANLGRVDLFV